jgi:hypothetical protein
LRIFCRIFPDGTGIQENQIGFFSRIGGIESVFCHDARHDFGIRKIHLASIAFYVQLSAFACVRFLRCKRGLFHGRDFMKHVDIGYQLGHDKAIKKGWQK